VVFALLVVVGGANSVIDVPLFSLPVRLAPDRVLARVFGSLEALVAIGVALGSAATPALIAVIGLPAALIGTGSFLPAVAAASWRHLNSLDRRLGVRDDDLRVLHGLPMFGLLPVPSIEHLAARLRHVAVSAGDTVFDQGSIGRQFYVIADGRADVVGDGAVVRTLGPGDCFGEIAILRDVPRTAAVRANGELALFEIDGDVFLETMAGHSVSSDAAAAVVARQLADFRPAGFAV
jgi:hypothetical protein